MLSKASMKRAGTVLEMENDRAVMFNKPVRLDFTSSGRYSVNIMNNNKRYFKVMNRCWQLQKITLKENKKKHEETYCKDEILSISEKLSSDVKQII